MAEENKKETEEKKYQQTSEMLSSIAASESKGDYVSIGELKESFGERGFGILMAIPSLPLCIPVPVPPIYTPFFALPLLIFAFQMLFSSSSPWLPSWLTNKRIKRKTLARIIEKGVPYLKKIEKLLHPRITTVSTRNWERIMGAFSIVFAISICLPIPLTNLMPAFGILIMSIGLLGKDGLMIIIGAILGSIGVLITIFVIIFGAKFVNQFLF